MLNLSNEAKIILKHLSDNNIQQLENEYPVTLAALFADPVECERAQVELYGHGLVDLGPATQSGVRAAAITLKGKRYIENNEL